MKRIRLFRVCFLPEREFGKRGGVAALRYIWSLKWSLAGFAAAFLASFLSFGLLGYVLYYAAYPVVGIAYPALSTWRGGDSHSEPWRSTAVACRSRSAGARGVRVRCR